MMHDHIFNKLTLGCDITHHVWIFTILHHHVASLEQFCIMLPEVLVGFQMIHPDHIESARHEVREETGTDYETKHAADKEIPHANLVLEMM